MEFDMRIDKHIPAPRNQSGRKKYPFGDMDIGDSIFFPMCPDGSQSLPALAARAHGNYYGKKFTAAKEAGPGGLTGVRIWRIA